MKAIFRFFPMEIPRDCRRRKIKKKKYCNNTIPMTQTEEEILVKIDSHAFKSKKSTLKSLTKSLKSFA